MKKLLPVIISVAVVLLALFAYSRWLRSRDTVEITSVVTKTREMARLTTATFSEQTVIIMRKDRYASGKVNVVASKSMVTGSGKDELCVIVDARVRAGFDLSNLQESDIEVCPTGDTVTVALGPVDIFEVSVNPSDKKIFSRTGVWTSDDEKTGMEQAKRIIAREAIDAGLVTRAKSSGEKQVRNIFKSFGYSEVRIIYKQDNEPPVDIEKVLLEQEPVPLHLN